MSVSNQTALITGASSKNGIGFQVARVLSSEGARVILVDVDEEKLHEAKASIEMDGGEAAAIEADVTDVNRVQCIVQQIENEYETIHILVNNAAVNYSTSIDKITEKEWDYLIDVNLKSPFFMTQSVLSVMKKNKYGRIINMASVAGKQGGGIFGGSHYAASKAGLLGLTKAVAREYAPYDITCNSVVPGFIENTDLTKGKISSGQLLKIKENTLIKRFGTTQDVAHTVLFLASPQAGYITGEDIDVNGGSYID